MISLLVQTGSRTYRRLNPYNRYQDFWQHSWPVWWPVLLPCNRMGMVSVFPVTIKIFLNSNELLGISSIRFLNYYDRECKSMLSNKIRKNRKTMIDIVSTHDQQKRKRKRHVNDNYQSGTLGSGCQSMSNLPFSLRGNLTQVYFTCHWNVSTRGSIMEMFAGRLICGEKTFGTAPWDVQKNSNTT